MEAYEWEGNNLFGVNLRYYRHKRGLTQEALGKILGVQRTYICALEKGKGNPTMRNIELLAAGLGVQIAALFEMRQRYHTDA